jgi:hypothetical protein
MWARMTTIAAKCLKSVDSIQSSEYHVRARDAEISEMTRRNLVSAVASSQTIHAIAPLSTGNEQNYAVAPD